MIPKRQHMEQTTEGTISYFLSISWSHFSPTSAKPSSLLVEVMVTEVEEGRLMEEEDWRGSVEISGSAGLTHGDASACKQEEKSDEEDGGGEVRRKQSDYWLLFGSTRLWVLMVQ